MALFESKESDTAEKEFKPVPEGTYQFKVDVAETTTFKTGSRGVKLQLLAGTDEGDVRVFENLVDSPKAMWKIKQFCKAVGKDVDSLEAVEDLEGLTGQAEFVTGERGYLQVDKFLPAGEPSPRPGKGAAPKDSMGDVPF